jgi:hypothetical protein
MQVTHSVELFVPESTSHWRVNIPGAILISTKGLLRKYMSWLRSCGFLGVETDSNIKREGREGRGSYKRKGKSRGRIRNRSFTLINIKSLAPNSKKGEIFPLQEQVSK